VLTGAGTCGVAEQFVNGLSPYVTVVTVGAATCGKPFGSVPVSNCGTTYSIVNFEVTNGSGQGRYYGGLAPTCAVSEDYAAGAQGSDADPLMIAAEGYADTGACPAGLLAQPKSTPSRDALMAGFLSQSIRSGAVRR
jgi:hypothetical protein